MLVLFLSILENDDERRRFTNIYEQYHEKMEQVAMRILQEQHDAEDAVQNSFVQIIRHFDKVYTISCEELLFWIISIVKNEAFMILRKHRQNNTVPLEDSNSFERISGDTAEYEEIVGIFRQLPETYRAVLEMKVFIGYSDKEVAAHLGISETAVSTRANRGRALLKKMMEREGMYP